MAIVIGSAMLHEATQAGIPEESPVLGRKVDQGAPKVSSGFHKCVIFMIS